jgi:hypothetical protein
MERKWATQTLFLRERLARGRGWETHKNAFDACSLLKRMQVFTTDADGRRPPPTYRDGRAQRLLPPLFPQGAARALEQAIGECSGLRLEMFARGGLSFQRHAADGGHLLLRQAAGAFLQRCRQRLSGHPGIVQFAAEGLGCTTQGRQADGVVGFRDLQPGERRGGHPRRRARWVAVMPSACRMALSQPDGGRAGRSALRTAASQNSRSVSERTIRQGVVIVLLGVPLLPHREPPCHPRVAPLADQRHTSPMVGARQGCVSSVALPQHRVAPPTRKPRFVSIWTIPRRQPPLRFAASYRRFLTATDTAPTRRISKPSGSPTEHKSRATPWALVARGARVRRAFLLPAVNYPQLHPASRTRITAILRDHRQFPALTTHLACFFPVRSPFSADGLITGFAF